MPIDTSIYSNLLRPPRSVADYDNEFATTQANALGLQLKQQELAQVKQAQADDMAQRDAWRAGGSPNDVANRLFSGGFGNAGMAIQKQLLGNTEAQSKINHFDAQSGKLKTETTGLETDQKMKLRAQAVQDIAALPGPDEARAGILGHLQKGDIDIEKATMLLQSVPQDPAQFPQWKHSMLLNIMAPKDQIETQQKADQFGVTSKEIARGHDLTANTALTTNAATNSRMAAEGAANRGVTMRGQNLTDARSKEAFNAPQYMETDAGLVALPKKLALGTTPTGTPVTMADGTPLGKPLKDIPAAVNTAIIANSQATSKIDRALTLLGGTDVSGMKGDKNATGARGYLPNGLLNRIDPQGVDARAEISDIGSLKIHDRSGAAVTVSESPRLMPFIPLATDDSATVKKKLGRLKLELASESQALSDTYSKGQGYKASPVAAKPGGSLTAAEQSELEQLRARFGKGAK